MKKFLSVFIAIASLVILTNSGYAQSTKKNIKELPRLGAAPALNDLTIMWDTSEGTTKKMTIADLNAAIGYSTLTGGHGITISNDTIKLTDSVQYGMFLPDTSNVVGTDTISLDSAYYVRVGKAVTVWGGFKTYIVASQFTFNMSIPKASNFTNRWDLGGTASSNSGCAGWYADTTNDKAIVDRVITSANPKEWTYLFTYYIK